MGWADLAQLGVVGLALLLGILYARASSKAALADNLKNLNDYLVEGTKAQRTVIAGKEEYIRELEKTVLGTLSPGELANRLNRMFAASRSGAPSPLPASKPKTNAP